MAEENGWRIVKGKKGHAWGRMYCPYGNPECAISIYSTPRNPENHAKNLIRAIHKCPGPNELPQAQALRELCNHDR